MPLKIKDAGLRIRVERDMREEFVELCREEGGKTAAQVLREFMAEYIARARAGAQQELWVQEPQVLATVGQGRASMQRSARVIPKAKRARNARHP